MNWIEKIKTCFENDNVLYTRHAKQEMHNEELGIIFEREINESIENGKIIEEYLSDKPYPSVLIFGLTKSKKPLHLVCAYSQKEKLTIIITVYQPNPKRWIKYRTRKKQ